VLPEFDLVEPRSLEDALECLADPDRRGAPLAGGTNLLIDLRARRVAPARLLGLGRLEELRGIRRVNGQIAIGARATLTDVAYDPLVASEAPGLVASARVFGGAMVRNVATVAGNLCYGSPEADLVPPLIALDAEVVLRSSKGRRRLPLEAFSRGVRRTDCGEDELMTEVLWPARPERSAHLFYKIGLRRGDAIAVASVAVLLAAEGGRCSRARIALGAVAPTVVRAREAERLLEGEALSERILERAAESAGRASAPIDDLRASAEYRRHAVRVLTRRLLGEAWACIA
jgi:carbon-monoxide dehydrogenase medium subunit